MNKPARGSLLDIEHLSAAEITGLLKLARRMNPLKPRPLLRGKRVLLLFYEPSTRTRSSFEIAAKEMGAMTTLVLSSGSSIEKGESLLDTAYTLQAVGADVMVIRNPYAGAPLLMATHLKVPVINAGDGMHEHPSQALLDAYTILRHKKTLSGLRVVIIGDIYHSRVARSAIHLLSKFGAQVTLCGPPEFLPELATCLAPGLHITRSAEEAVRGADVIMVLRVQKERLAGMKIRLQDYITRYQMTMARVKLAKSDALVMHPGPIIRGLELTWEVADCPQSVIVEEVHNEYVARRQQRLLGMDQNCDVQPRARDQASKQTRKPHGVTRDPDDRHAPKYAPVVQLFPICVAVILGLRAQKQEPPHLANQILEVLQIGHHRVRPPQQPPLFLGHQAITDIGHMRHKSDGKNHRAQLVKEEHGCEAAHQLRKVQAPCRAAEAQREAGRRQD
jgi:aspartate carbamoyltransferase catalytic subunit